MLEIPLEAFVLPLKFLGTLHFTLHVLRTGFSKQKIKKHND
jgi:hypothetical protein